MPVDVFPLSPRRTALGALLAFAGAGALAQPAGARPDTLRIGCQKSSTLTVVLKTRGTLEQLFAPEA